MHKLIAYVTGTISLVIVIAAAVSATTYAVANGSETFSKLGTATLSGIGVAVGGGIGGALLLRFKMARQFIRSVIYDINDTNTKGDK